MRKSGGRPLYRKASRSVLGCPAAVYAGTKPGILLPRNGRISLARTTFPLCEHGWTRLNVYPAGHRKLNSWTAINDDPAILHPYLSVPPTSFVSLRFIERGWTCAFFFVSKYFFVQFRNTDSSIFAGIFGGKEGRKIILVSKLDLYLQNTRWYIVSFLLIRWGERSNFISLFNFFT